ncbi:MAG: hypothetical protein CTY12_01235 [Methylotenera sp.]|nr:MAG: hypothetical protein CTY12_01235 [Methylotenera sp.]
MDFDRNVNIAPMQLINSFVWTIVLNIHNIERLVEKQIFNKFKIGNNIMDVNCVGNNSHSV